MGSIINKKENTKIYKKSIYFTFPGLRPWKSDKIHSRLQRPPLSIILPLLFSLSPPPPPHAATLFLLRPSLIAGDPRGAAWIPRRGDLYAVSTGRCQSWSVVTGRLWAVAALGLRLFVHARTRRPYKSGSEGFWRLSQAPRAATQAAHRSCRRYSLRWILCLVLPLPAASTSHPHSGGVEIRSGVDRFLLLLVSDPSLFGWMLGEFVSWNSCFAAAMSNKSSIKLWICVFRALGPTNPVHPSVARLGSSARKMVLSLPPGLPPHPTGKKNKKKSVHHNSDGPR